MVKGQKPCTFDQHAVVHRRTYLSTYIVLPENKLPRNGKSRTVSSLRLFLYARVAPLQQLWSSVGTYRHGMKHQATCIQKGHQMSVYPQLTWTSLRRNQGTNVLCRRSWTRGCEGLREGGEKGEHLPLHCIIRGSRS